MFKEKRPYMDGVKLDYSQICSQVKFLQGKVLTVIEASNTNEKQLKAVKDLVNKMFSEQLTRVTQLCYPQLPMMSREEVAELGVDVEKVEREAETIK
jgi:hypothetical protein